MNTFRTSKDADDLLNEVEAADMLRISMRTLQSWRCKGIGPSFIRIGRSIRYRRGDLFDWARRNTVQSNVCTAPNQR